MLSYFVWERIHKYYPPHDPNRRQDTELQVWKLHSEKNEVLLKLPWCVFNSLVIPSEDLKTIAAAQCYSTIQCNIMMCVEFKKQHV